MNTKKKVLMYTLYVFLCVAICFVNVVLVLHFDCAGQVFGIALAFGTGIAIAIIHEEVSK